MAVTTTVKSVPRGYSSNPKQYLLHRARAHADIVLGFVTAVADGEGNPVITRKRIRTTQPEG